MFLAAAAPAATGATAATAATAAAGATTAAASTGFFSSLFGSTALSSMGTLLSLGLTGAGALAQVGAGNAAAAQGKYQAKQFEMNAKLEELKGRQEALSIKEKRDANLASINAIYAARGGVTSYGTPAQAAIEANKNAARDIDLALFGGNIRSMQTMAQAATARADGAAARTSGYGAAATTIAGSKSVQSLLDF